MRNLVLNQIDGISPRAVHCCSDVGILTLGDLFDYVMNRSLTTIKNCGMKTARELSRVMSQYEAQVLGFKYDLFAVVYDDKPQAEPPTAIAAEPDAVYHVDTPTLSYDTLSEPSAIDISIDELLADNSEFTAALIEEEEGEEEKEALDLVAEPETISLIERIYSESIATISAATAEKIQSAYPDGNSLLHMVLDSPQSLLESRDGWNIDDHFRFWDFAYETLEEMLSVVDREECTDLHNAIIAELEHISSHIRRRKLALVRTKLSALLGEV